MKSATIFSLAVALSTLAACSKDTANTADRSVMDTATPVAAAPEAPAPVSGMMDPNSAAATDLAGVTGMTSDLAAAVVAGRPYANMVAVDKILEKSMTKPQRDSLYTRVWIPIDLNKASDAEILMIPGVGARMLREFKEYRPFTSMEQFDREIGKYVDKAELARLGSYVKI